VLVAAYANLVDDPILRDAIALQGEEETRHARLIATLIDHYGVNVGEPSPIKLPQNIEQNFTDEEAHHIVFFINWFTYQQIQRGQWFAGLRAIPTLWHYGIALRSLLDAVGKGGTSGYGFTVTNANTFSMNLTLEGFLSTCLQENQRRMSKFDPELLQPQLMPKLTSIALRTLQLKPRRKPRAIESPNLS
jgi:hypothetical protein